MPVSIGFEKEGEVNKNIAKNQFITKMGFLAMSIRKTRNRENYYCSKRT
jgi:hypothetical protein